MTEPLRRWEGLAPGECPEDWLRAVQQGSRSRLEGVPRRAAQILWQRQLCDLDQVPGFLDPDAYRPTPASALGPDLTLAVARLQQALDQDERVTIWGDFDADGVTATAVLWDGLAPLFPKHQRLRYYIPNRMTESHGLSRSGLDQVRAWGTNLIVTCDTGSTNAAEIAYAQELGMAVIVTDHHTLLPEDPPAVALINPRRLPVDHPLATLSGVAVAYKLLEGLYEALTPAPAFNLDYVLDLVAIGLIADLVELKGDCRYLAQRGLRQLQTQIQSQPPYLRPGVAELLRLCKKTGDRPTDIAFGLGPRINAVSRIHGDASFCVELLTSQDRDYCRQLAYQAELANTRRKALQREMADQVNRRLGEVDLATTQCLVLADEQWPTGVLGLVAGQVSQDLGRPTVLLKLDPPSPEGNVPLARGSARSVPGLDLYELFQTQADLLTGFGGHPLAAGLALPVANLPLLVPALNRAVRERLGSTPTAQPSLTIDLVVTVADLGPDLFQELKLLEPYGMGNPTPKLLIHNGWFQRAFHKKLRDARGQAVGFIRTQFELWDSTVSVGFPGEWWGHYREELPTGPCDVVVELDHNGYSGYHVKLVDVRPAAMLQTIEAATIPDTLPSSLGSGPDWLTEVSPLSANDWAKATSAIELWSELVGIAKYLARTQTAAARSHLQQRLDLSSTLFTLGLEALATVGFGAKVVPRTEASGGDALGFERLTLPQTPDPTVQRLAIQRFLDAVEEERFRRRYAAQVAQAPVPQS